MVLSLPLPPPLSSRAALSLRRFGFEFKFGKIISKYFMEDANIGAVSASSSSIEQSSGFVSKEIWI